MNSNEMVGVKEAEKDVDETHDINLNDAIVEGDAKGPPLSHPGDHGQPENPTENGEPRAENKDYDVTKDVMESTVVEPEEKIPVEKVAEVADDKTLETFPGNKDNMVLRDSKIQENENGEGSVQANANGTHVDSENGKLNIEENADNGSDVVNIDADAKEFCYSKNEDIHLHNDKSLETKAEDHEKVEDSRKVEGLKHMVVKMDLSPQTEIKKDMPKLQLDEGNEATMNTPNKSFLVEAPSAESYDSGTEEEQAAFLKDVQAFYRENNLEFKAPKFYKEELNLLKLWRAVIKLGGYEQVTSCKLWRQVGESFRPPKTCTTVSWTFRIFYEKALLEYEKHKLRCGDLPFSDGSLTEPVRVEHQTPGSQILGSGRARRDAAARAMQGWHSQRLLGNGQVCDPIIKDKSLNSIPKRDKQQKTNGLLKRKKPSNVEHAVHVPHMKTMKLQADTMVIDIGPPADWVKINVQRTNDCFEIYALVPGLLREEVHVQSDPAGRLIISGQPEQLDNPWGVTPFKKVVSLPSRIDPHQTSAVVTLHGQLFVRVPFEQSDI